MFQRLVAASVVLGAVVCPVLVFAQDHPRGDHPAQKKPPEAKPANPATPSPAAAKTAPADTPKHAPAADAGKVAPNGMDPAAVQAAMKAMMPGPQHQKLAKLVGDWTIKAKMSIPGGPPPDESEGTAKLAMAFDGRFLHEDDAGTMMGMPFKGGKLLGFNNGSNKYEAVWVYTLGTGMMTMNGTSDDDGKTIKFTATFDNEIGIKETMKVTYKFADDDHFTVVLDGGKMPDGSPGPVMVADYTRKK